MADFGTGEAAATEGAKGAGEALAAPAAAEAVTPFAAAPAAAATTLAPAAAGAGGAAALEAGTAATEGAIAGGAGTPAVPGAIGAAAAAPEISASIAPEVAASAGGAAAAPDPLVANLASTGTAGSDIAGGGLSGAAAAPSAAVPSVGGAPDLGAGAGEVAAPAALPETPPYPAGTQAPAPVVEKSMQTPDWLSKGMGAIANMSPNTALTGAGLGLNAYSQIAARNAMGDMQKQIKGAVAPLSSTQQGLLTQYNSGQLSAADQQAIQDYTAASKAQIRQQYAQMGQANSPQMAQAEAAVDQKAAAMMDQALKNYLTEALSVTGAITGPYAGLATQQIAQDASLQNAAKGVFSAMGAQQSGRPAGT